MSGKDASRWIAKTADAFASARVRLEAAQQRVEAMLAREW